jgi:hypothetical protein
MPFGFERMVSLSKGKISSYVIEVGKWALIIWLLFPITGTAQGPINFARLALGVVLFVIFTGKLLYDVVFFPRQHQRESSAGKDLVSMIGIVFGIALLVLVLVVFVVMYVINYMSTVSTVR